MMGEFGQSGLEYEAGSLLAHVNRCKSRNRASESETAPFGHYVSRTCDSVIRQEVCGGTITSESQQQARNHQ